MNSLESLRHARETGLLGKQEYIEAIHARHAALFDYPAFIADTDVESLRILPDGVFVRSRSQQVELWVDPDDQHLVPCTLMNFRAYEAAETSFLKSITGNDWTMIDIGANCGWYSLALAKAYPGMVIHACEPIAKTHGILERNIRHNGLLNIQTHQLGFSDKEGKLQFLYTPGCSGATSLIHAGQPVRDASALQEISCECTTLDQFCRQFGISPQLVKCDVEGAELMVVQGGEQTLSKAQPVILIELLRKWAEKFGYHPNDVLALLAGYGYSAFTLGTNGLQHCPAIDQDTIETNFIFLHQERHREIIER